MQGKVKVNRKGKRKGKRRKELKGGGPSESKTSKGREKYARVLEYLPYGHLDDSRPIYQKKPLVQAIGEDKFVLMELSPKKDTIPAPYDQVYIGEGEREVIDHVIRRLKYKELTPTAKEELPYILEKIIKDNEERFIKVFNKPKGILKKYMRDEELHVLLAERRKKEFSDFEDLTKRVNSYMSFNLFSHRVQGLYHPEKIIAKIIEDKIIEEKQEVLKDIITDKERTENLGPHDLGFKMVKVKGKVK